jgi:uncharacterized membrane protein YraQ (UPF0718 family)
MQGAGLFSAPTPEVRLPEFGLVVVVSSRMKPSWRPDSKMFEMMVATRTSFQTTRNRLRVSYSVILLAALITGLIGYKGYSGLSKLHQVHASGTLELRDDVLRTSLGSAKFGFLARSVEYLQIVWPALLFGILIAAAVHAFVSPAWFVRGLGEGAIREQVTAAMAGTPLMLCSCCASPLFSATYERSRRLSPSLALMLASPGMNPASLALCFMLFPTRLAAARVVMTLVAVLLASALPDLLVRGASQPNYPTLNMPVAEPKTFGLRELLATYLHSCGHIAIRTVPLLLLGTLVAMLIPGRLLAQTFASIGGGIVVIALVALFALPLALPSFFEIPLALSILAAGAPLGAAAAVLFAGPIVNLPSLLVVGRNAGWKVSALLASSVWVIAFLGGLVLH